MSSGVKILKCTCNHPFQDETYGKSNRVFNHADGKGSKKGRYRCTVCKALKEV